MSRMIPVAWPVTHADRPLRVLVVDDNPVNLMVMSAQLASRGLLSLVAAHGAEAVMLACARPVDLILMDLQMPVLDGIAATGAIRRFEAAWSRPAVPVLAFSSQRLGTAELAAHGMNGSLAKPCDDQDLEDCLARWCPTYRPAPAVRRGLPDHASRHAAGRASAVEAGSPPPP